MTQTVLELTEYQPLRLLRDGFPYQLGQVVLDRYSDKVKIEYPTPKTRDHWELISQGWVGALPLEPEFVLRLLPKVPIQNVFRMLEVAYRFQAYHFLKGLTSFETLEDYVTALASALAKGVLSRAKRGLYRSYLGQQEDLPYLRGRLDFAPAVKRPWIAKLNCLFEEHTTDVPDNQILGWGLHCAHSAGLCRDWARGYLREASRCVRSFAALTPYSGRDCVGRDYTRLNNDYEPLHALCRFFIDHSSPSHHAGDMRSLPFLIDMASLFEMFVAEWLRDRLPSNFRLLEHHHIRLGAHKEVLLDIDLVIERDDGLPLWVLDTKYKVPEGGPSNEDLYQVVSYAHGCGAPNAALIYPSELSQPYDFQWHTSGVRVKTIAFSLNHDLDKAGAFLVNTIVN